MNESRMDTDTIPDLARFIRSRTDEVLLYPNRGNAGDSLIAAGTCCFFEENGIPYRFIRDEDDFSPDKTLWYSGGGNFVHYYGECARWLKKHGEANPCVVLPHTINDTEALKQLPEHTTLICRERESYRICKEHARCEVLLSPDMAFHLKPEYLGVRRKPGRGNLLVFRKDPEKNIPTPKGACDISRFYAFDQYDARSIRDCARYFLETINDFETIYTDRLHVAVGGYLLHKKVRLFPNSYYKNRAVFEFSLKDFGVEFDDGSGVFPPPSTLRNACWKCRGKLQKIRCKFRKLMRR